MDKPGLVRFVVGQRYKDKSLFMYSMLKVNGVNDAALINFKRFWPHFQNRLMRRRPSLLCLKPNNQVRSS